MQGIWGDISYLDNLRKYNSVSEARKKIKFDTDIKVSSNNILVCRPDYIEAMDFYSEQYELLFVENEMALFEKDKNFGEQQKYQKLADLSDDNIWRLWGDEYSAISIMEWKWFEGKYESYSMEDKTKKIIEFSDKGIITDENRKLNYFFGTNSRMQEYIAFEIADNNYKYYLLEYNNGIFYCFKITNLKNWDNPIPKEVLEFKLQRINWDSVQ